MSKTEEFISSEKEYYGKIFSDIAFAIDEITDFIYPNTLKNRKYHSRQAVVKKYIELLNSAEVESKKKGFLGGLFEGDKYTSLLQDYKVQHKEELTQLKNCANCECLKCTLTCKFDTCIGCSNGKYVANCDHKSTNVVFFDSPEYSNLRLVNNTTGIEDDYTILALVQDSVKDKRYILIENRLNKERFILYYYPKLPEDDYGEITDETDFNFAAGAYENVDRT